MPKEQVFDFYVFNQYSLINRYSICWFSDSVMLFKQQDPFDISKGSKFIILIYIQPVVRPLLLPDRLLPNEGYWLK